MGFNRRKMEDQRREAAEKEAAKRRATEARVLEDAERLIAAWNERQAKRMPMLFSPTIGAALARDIGFCNPDRVLVLLMGFQRVVTRPFTGRSLISPARRRQSWLASPL